MGLMFEMTMEVAEEFYRRCCLLKEDNEENRIGILIDLAKEGRMNSVMKTNRTPDQIAEDCAKNFGNVLYIKKKEENT